jgi:hypothetical protein
VPEVAEEAVEVVNVAAEVEIAIIEVVEDAVVMEVVRVVAREELAPVGDVKTVVVVAAALVVVDLAVVCMDLDSRQVVWALGAFKSLGSR